LSPPYRRPRPPASWPILLAIPALPLAGCDENVGCVFTTGCQGGSGALSDNEALLPVDGDWIVDGPPKVEGVFPSGTQNPGTTPIVVVFSETMQEESLDGAIRVVPLSGGQPLPPVDGLGQVLASDGRVLILLPPEDDALDAGSYAVVLDDRALGLDLSGQELDADPGASLGTFSVAAPGPSAPRLVTSFPPDGARDQGETPEIVAVFDRPVVQGSVDGASFDVRVAGVDPAQDPPAQPILVRDGATTTADTRVFLYRSVGADGRPVALGRDVEVELRLASSIVEADGGALAATNVSFRTMALSAPLAASLLSDPNDAIGLANLTPGDSEELALEVELDDAEPGDSIDLVLFGLEKSEDDDPLRIAVLSTVRLSGAAPIQSVIVGREDVGLQLSDEPDDVRFEDGAITFALRARRGRVVSPVRLLDLDPAPDTIRDPLLDTIRPEIESLLGSADARTFRTDQRGLSLAGVASESLRSVEVSTLLGGNGSLAPAVGSGARTFLAAPVAGVGRIPGGSTTFSATGRDAAHNASPGVSGDVLQFGAVGPGALAPGDSIVVEVFDASTLDLLEGARVSVHSDHGNGSAYPLFSSGPTLPDGRVTLPTEGAPSVAAIVTVALDGFDLFTLHGAPSPFLSVPLRPSSRPASRATGAVRSSDGAAIGLLPGLDRRYDDSRRGFERPRGFAGLPCTSGAAGLACSYGPEVILDSVLGARSFLAGDFSQGEAAFGVAQLLQAFALSLPLAPAVSGQLQSADLTVESLLLDPGTPPEEAAQAVPAFTFHVRAGSGVDLQTLADDPATSGAPFVSVDALVPGMAGSIGVGLGLAYDLGGGRWTVRAGFAGAVSAAGSLGSAGSVDSDPFVRVEVLDLAGNAAGIRQRVQAIAAAGGVPEFDALDVPELLAPAPGASAGGQAFTLVLRHAIGDDRTEPGIYRVELTDEGNRRWTLWRFDGPGSGDVTLRVVDLPPGEGLEDGTVVCTAAAYAWPSLSTSDFFWSDVARAFELFARDGAVSFSKP
jgi:hypothetical protein